MAWDFLQLNDPAKVAEARGTSWGSALGQDFNPRNPNYQGYRTAPGNVAAANRVGLGSYINQGINSLRGVFQPGSNVGGATTLMRKMALSPVGRVAGAAMSLPALGAYGLYKTPDMINALTARDPNATESSLFGIDLTKNANEQAALPESELQDWGSTMGVIPGDDLPNPVVTSRLNKLDPNWEHQLRMQGIDRGNIDNKGFNFPNLSLTGILNTLTGRKGADQSFGGYPGGWESRAGLFPNEVTNLQRLADKGYLAGGGKDIFGTNVVSAVGDYDKAMENQLGVFKKTMGKKGYEDLDELEKYYLDAYGKDSRLYNKLRHVRGWNQPGDGTEQKTYLDKIQTTTPKTTTTGGSSTPREMEIARRGGYNPSAQSFSSHSPGGISQATSRAARGDPTGTGGGWGLAQGGRAGYREGQFVDEDINIQGPGFDVNENVMMASAPDPMDALNDMSMNIFGKPLNLLNEEEYQMLIDMANDQASMGQDEGIASLV